MKEFQILDDAENQKWKYFKLNISVISNYVLKSDENILEEEFVLKSSNYKITHKNKKELKKKKKDWHITGDNGDNNFHRVLGRTVRVYVLQFIVCSRCIKGFLKRYTQKKCSDN